MGKSKKIIIIVIVVVAIVLTGIVVELLLLKNGEGKEISNNQEENVQANEQNSIGVEEPNFNTFLPSSNDVEGGGTTGDPSILLPISTKYYYNQLNDSAKIIYDKFQTNKDKFKDGNYIFDFGSQFNTLLHTDTGTDELNKAFQSAIDAFFNDQVDLFYVDTSKINLITKNTTLDGINTYKVTVEPREEGSYLKSDFSTKEEVEKSQYYVKYMLDQIIDQTQADSIYQKVRKVHEWLIRYIDYDENSKNSSNIFGALLDKKANYEGYSKTFKYILEQIGVSCVVVPGTIANSQTKNQKHMWNYLQLNSLWYAVDVTLDDPILEDGGVEVTEEMMTKYFLKGSTTWKKEYKETGLFSENGTEFKFPEISSQDY